MDPTKVLLWESSPTNASKKQGGFRKKKHGKLLVMTYKQLVACRPSFRPVDSKGQIHGFPLILGKDTVMVQKSG